MALSDPHLSDEAKIIVKAMKKNPHYHIHYFADRMWSMYPSKKLFEEYWENGDGDKDLSDIEIMEGNDFDSDFRPPVVEAQAYMNGGTTSSI